MYGIIMVIVVVYMFMLRKSRDDLLDLCDRQNAYFEKMVKSEVKVSLNLTSLQKHIEVVYMDDQDMIHIPKEDLDLYFKDIEESVS